MNEALLLAVQRAVEKNPAFRRAAQSNYLNQFFLDALVWELGMTPSGKPRRLCKIRERLRSINLGTSRGKMPRVLLQGDRKSPLAKVMLAMERELSEGTAGRRVKRAAREELDDFLRDLPDAAWTLLTKPGRPGSRMLNAADARSAALVHQLATRYGVSEHEMLVAINKSRDWLARTFGTQTLDDLRRQAHRMR